MANKDSLLALHETTVGYDAYTQLRDKYDALKHRFNLVTLEKDEYEKEIKKMHQHIGDLSEQAEYKQSESTQYELLTQPMLSSSLNMLSSALEASDTMRELAIDKNLQYELMIDTLTEQKTDLHEQNKQYADAVETIRNNVYKREIDYEGKIQQLNAQIDVLKEEYMHIFEKYDVQMQENDMLKKRHEAELKTQMEISTPNPDVEVTDDTFPSFVVPFLRSLSNNELAMISKHTSNPKLQSYGVFDHKYDSMGSLLEEDHEYIASEDEGYGSDGIPTTAMPGIVEHSERFMKQEDKLDKETQMFVVNMMNTVHQKDVQIEKLADNIDKKEQEIQSLNKIIIKLRKENTTLLRHTKRTECQPCMGFKWGGY